MKTAEIRSRVAYVLKPVHLGVYILLATLVWSYSYYTTRLITTRGSISVTGVAYEDVSSDQAQWTIEIEKTSPDRKQSYELLLADEKKLQSFLAQKGLTSWGPTSYDTQPVYKKATGTEFSGDTNEIERYRSTGLFGISTEDVHKVNDVSGSMHAYLINENITLTRNEVEYFYTSLEGLKISLLEKAIANAKERARAIGKNANTSIGRIITANQGIFQINSAGDTSVSDYGNYDTSSIDKTIRALVTVEFESR